jgi:hypothetical protein
MTGVKGKSGRPGGAPENLIPYTTDREEPLLAQLQLRVPESLKAELKEIPGWQEFVRKAIRKAIAERNRRSALAKQSKGANKNKT